MAIRNFPCDGKCDKCKFEDCILTEEQALQLDIYENGNNIDRINVDVTTSKSKRKYYRCRENILAYRKQYYQEHKEKLKEAVKKSKRANREYYNAKDRQRDRKEYYRQYYLKRKAQKNESESIVSSNVVGGFNIDTADRRKT